MIVKNLTSEMKEIEVREITGSRVYKCYIEPHGQTDLENMILVNQEALKGVEVLGYTSPTTISTIVSEVSPSEDMNDTPASVEEESDDVPVSDVQVNEDKFICDECGAEFASSRSLSSHKSRSHNK